MLATPPPFPGRPASPQVEPRAVHSDGRSSFLKRFPLPLTAFHSQCHCLFPHLLLGFHIVTAFSFETLYLNKVFCKGNTVAKLCSPGGHSLYQELLRASHASRPFPRGVCRRVVCGCVLGALCTEGCLGFARSRCVLNKYQRQEGCRQQAELLSRRRIRPSASPALRSPAPLGAESPAPAPSPGPFCHVFLRAGACPRRRVPKNCTVTALPPKAGVFPSSADAAAS